MLLLQHPKSLPPPQKKKVKCKIKRKKLDAEHYFCVGTDGSVWFSCIPEFSSLRIFRLGFILIIHSLLNFRGWEIRIKKILALKFYGSSLCKVRTLGSKTSGLLRVLSYIWSELYVHNFIYGQNSRF